MVPTTQAEAVRVWGVPFVPWTMDQTLDRIDDLVARRESHYFITANLNYVMLCDRNARLREINEKAAFILADGKPIVWASKFGKSSLPERVAGADLIPKLCERAAQKGHRLYFLAAPPAPRRRRPRR